MTTREQRIEIAVESSPHRGHAGYARIAASRRAVRARLGRQPAAIPGAGARDRRAGLRVPHFRPTAAMPARSRSARPCRARAICATCSPPTTCWPRHPHVDASAIAVVGSSYGGYLAAILTTMRPVRWLALARAGALHRLRLGAAQAAAAPDQDLRAYRRSFVRADKNRALRACAAFKGDVLLSNRSTTTSSRRPSSPATAKPACTARSLTYRCMAGRRPRAHRRREPARVHRAAHAMAGRDAAEFAPRRRRGGGHRCNGRGHEAGGRAGSGCAGDTRGAAAAFVKSSVHTPARRSPRRGWIHGARSFTDRCRLQ